uniref:Uncharacterized protein n=1 Tax=viral metagenome TaxID=1070528 RepID=A0A6M3JTE3_9ZZZZ
MDIKNLTNIWLSQNDDGIWLAVDGGELKGLISIEELDRRSGMPVFSEWAKSQLGPELLQKLAMKQLDVGRWHKLFQSGQYGRFYISNSKDAYDVEFCIQILPNDTEAIPNGNRNLCLNKDAVLIFGPRWRKTGEHGKGVHDHEWFYNGPWIEDFHKLVDELQLVKNEQEKKELIIKTEADQAEKDKIAALLAAY